MAGTLKHFKELYEELIITRRAASSEVETQPQAPIKHLTIEEKEISKIDSSENNRRRSSLISDWQEETLASI